MPHPHPPRTPARVDAVDGKIVDVGDHRQIPSVDVGGGHYALAQRLGVTVLGHDHWFRGPVYRDAAQLLRDRQPAAADQVLRAQGAVSDHHARPVDARVDMVDDWLTQRGNGDQTLMLATERASVAELNQLARARLVARGDIARRSRTYKSHDNRRTVTLGVGDEVILRRNHRLTQPDGTTVAVRNGMIGRVTATRRREFTVDLDGTHRSPEGHARVTLPADYVGAHVEYAYPAPSTPPGARPSITACSRPPRRRPRACVRRAVPRATVQPHLRHRRPRLDRRHRTAPWPRARRRPETRHPPNAATSHSTRQPGPRPRPSTATRGRSVAHARPIGRGRRDPGRPAWTHRRLDRPAGVRTPSPEAGRSAWRTIADPGNPGGRHGGPLGLSAGVRHRHKRFIRAAAGRAWRLARHVASANLMSLPSARPPRHHSSHHRQYECDRDQHAGFD